MKRKNKCNCIVCKIESVLITLHSYDLFTVDRHTTARCRDE
jgi:hypothetical protein